ncbi:MAG: DUF1631 domain-containing protein [Pseudomonadales bacterium]|nr:DUF1631 domain-containing protein [Pseudomonadales bacterium]
MTEKTLSANNAFEHAKNYLSHILNKSMMAMYMDGAKKKTELDGLAIEEISAKSAERIFGQKAKLFASIFCLIEMGFKNLAKTDQQRSVSLKVESSESRVRSVAQGKQRIVDKYVGIMKIENGVALARLTYHLEQRYKHHLSIAYNPINPENLARYISVSIHTLDLDDNEKMPLLAILLDTLSSEYEELLRQTEQGVVGLHLPELSDEDVAFRYEDEHAREESIIKRKGFWNDMSDGAELDPLSVLSIVSEYVKAAREDSEPLGYLISVEPGLPLLEGDALAEGMLEIFPLPDFSLDGFSDGQLFDSETYLPLDEDVPSLAFQVQQVLDLHDCGLEPASIDTLNLLSMMFVYLDQETHIHPDIKMLLDHMRVPFVRVAINDPYFMFDARNPVQVLFDTLWSACIKWIPSIDGKRDSVYNKVASILETMSQHFTDDYQAVDECIEDMDLFNKAEKRRSKLIEGRLISTEKARFQKEEAISKTDSYIAEKFPKATLPSGFLLFIESTWKSVVLMVNLKNFHQDGPEWRKVIEVENQLLSVVTGKESKDIDVLLGRVNELITLYGTPSLGIKQGSNAGSNQGADDSIDNLRRILSMPSSVGASTLSMGGLPLPEMEVMEEEYIDPEDFGKTGGQSVDQFQEVVDKLFANTWVESMEEGVVSKSRVATVLSYSDTLVLVNRTGARAGVYAKEDLADKLRSGDLSMSILDTTLFFDRALEGVDKQLGARH